MSEAYRSQPLVPLLHSPRSSTLMTSPARTKTPRPSAVAFVGKRYVTPIRYFSKSKVVNRLCLGNAERFCSPPCRDCETQDLRSVHGAFLTAKSLLTRTTRLALRDNSFGAVARAAPVASTRRSVAEEFALFDRIAEFDENVLRWTAKRRRPKRYSVAGGDDQSKRIARVARLDPLRISRHRHLGTGGAVAIALRQGAPARCLITSPPFDCFYQYMPLCVYRSLVTRGREY